MQPLETSYPELCRRIIQYIPMAAHDVGVASNKTCLRLHVNKKEETLTKTYMSKNY